MRVWLRTDLKKNNAINLTQQFKIIKIKNRILWWIINNFGVSCHCEWFNHPEFREMPLVQDPLRDLAYRACSPTILIILIGDLLSHEFLI